MDSILERQRQIHEELERSELSAVNLNLLKLSTNRHLLGREHKLYELVERIRKQSKVLKDLYDDSTGLRRKEIEKKSEGGGLNEFYNQLAHINNYHRKNPGQVVEPIELEFEKFSKAPESKEERDARLKLIKKKKAGEKLYDSSAHTFGHSKLEKDILARKAEVARLSSEAGKKGYSNDEILEDIEPEYFLSKVDEANLDNMFSGEELMGRYLDLVSLHEEFINIKHVEPISYLKYLSSFSKFEELSLKSKKSPEYSKYLKRLNDYLESFIFRTSPMTDLAKIRSDYNNSDNVNLEENLIVQVLIILNIEYVGDKHFEKQTTFNGHLNGKKHKNAEKLLNELNSKVDPSELNKEAASSRFVLNVQLESQIISYCNFLSEKIQDTCANVERKQVLTHEERNGRKAFDLHFQEARHSNNMKRLGIPNTRQFHDIYRIEDAVALWEKIKSQKTTNTNSLDTFEEFEDSEGNVFNRKTYEDLKRQGLL
ncbi:Splicing factor 3A subunit 3 [Smittium culicis]|uniref:Splicing factor 3A subunit 3 n=1 Tax=Smittium culicis TaxID=133412 RepID=A0A1R1YED4_9FUNG|nr:Splicing factor 3A subunit 3 [Smittium culicis]